MTNGYMYRIDTESHHDLTMMVEDLSSCLSNGTLYQYDGGQIDDTLVETWYINPKHVLHVTLKSVAKDGKYLDTPIP